jgi:hypothetical protein
MKSTLTLLIFSLCFAIPSPSRGAEEVSNVYFPLEVGLVWTADVVATSPKGERMQGTGTREITGTKEVGGKTYVVMKTTIEGIPGFGTFVTYRRQQADGIYYIAESDPEKKEYLEMPLPPAVGKSWEVPVASGKFLYRIEAVEAATVGETKYEKCLKVSYRSDTINFSSYYHAAPGIGNVTETMSLSGGRIVFTHKALVKREPGIPNKTDAPK